MKAKDHFVIVSDNMINQAIEKDGSGHRRSNMIKTILSLYINNRLEIDLSLEDKVEKDERHVTLFLKPSQVNLAIKKAEDETKQRITFRRLINLIVISYLHKF